MSYAHTPKTLNQHTAIGLMTDEPVRWAKEFPWVDTKLPGAIAMRVQLVAVERGDAIVTFKTMLGPESLFNAPPMQFWAAGLYSVGEVVQDIMPRLREQRPAGEEPTDLVGDWFKELDERQAQRAHRTVNGPFVTIQR